MAAFERAVELGAEMLEVDVNLTRDGGLVIIHDTTLDRTTSGSGAVSAHTWAEIAELDAGAWFDGGFAGECLPRPEDVLDLAREAGIGVCFEVKGSSSPEALQIAQKLLRLMVSAGALEWTVLSGYDHGVLAWARSTMPGLVVAPDRVPDNVPADIADACGQAARVRATVMQNHYSFLTPSLVDAWHAMDVAVWAWPTTSEESITTSLAAGVDGLMGDDVAVIVRVLDQQQRAS
jgi:glycerophosphoryl diester phosphodiesterase